MHQQHRPLASFSTMFRDYTPPNPKPVAALAKPVVDATTGEKQKIKIIIVAKKTSAPTTTTTYAAPAPIKKIKITIKKQPKEEEKQQQHFNDIAPPSSMFFKPYSDYTVPPPKCCRFFIDNRHCFLRSTDNACIDTITKKVFGFWNCEIGAKCKLLHVGHDVAYEVCGEKENLLFNNHDDDNHDDIQTCATEMRKNSDANRARLTGQPVALLRHKIAMQYKMHDFNSHRNLTK
jgi:hypothetical protein